MSGLTLEEKEKLQAEVLLKAADRAALGLLDVAKLADLQLQAVARAAEEVAKQSAAKRKVELLWELTQSFIAVSVVAAALAGAFVFGMMPKPSETPAMLGNAFFLVVGYFIKSKTGNGHRPPPRLRNEALRSGVN